ncbi:MAG: outer membrane beta-barrel protein [Acidobacteria bacterium]|nr:outer membrane beta-barrel protein [Acidobacteriota bacterium]
MTTSVRWAVFSVMAVLAPAAAQAQITRVSGSDTRQSIGVNLGAFLPKGEDSRVDGDVLFRNGDSLLFDIKDFTGASVGAEYLVGVSRYIEAGLDVSFYQRTVPSIYRDVVNANDLEIEQDLKLRIIPVTASVRFLPTGRDASVQPYIGIGASLLNWRYSETGEFVDFTDDSIFRDRFVAKGNTVAPVVMGGLRFLAADVWTIGGELRYQRAEGDTGGRDAGFLGDKIDLGGWTANFNVHYRF